MKNCVKSAEYAWQTMVDEFLQRKPVGVGIIAFWVLCVVIVFTIGSI